MLDKNDMGHWVCDIPVPKSAMGFIYLITCKAVIDGKINNRKYIGKKQILSKQKKKPLKGKINKRSTIKETDWKTYCSSSNQLQTLITEHGIESFEFRIIRFCNSKSELAYYEAKEQFDRDALLSDEYLNGIVNLRIAKIRIDPLEY